MVIGIDLVTSIAILVIGAILYVIGKYVPIEPIVNKILWIVGLILIIIGVAFLIYNIVLMVL